MNDVMSLSAWREWYNEAMAYRWSMPRVGQKIKWWSVVYHMYLEGTVESVSTEYGVAVLVSHVNGVRQDLTTRWGYHCTNGGGTGRINQRK